MPQQKLISDIRFFESDDTYQDGTIPESLGTLVQKPVSELHSIGQRMAEKLRELGFVTGDFDHVYINLTSAYRVGTVQLAQCDYSGILKRIRYFNTGARFSKINGLTRQQRYDWFAKTTIQVLRYIASDDEAQLKLIDRVEELHKQFGEELLIVWKSKSTKTYEIVVSFQVAKPPKNSSAWIRYHNKSTGETREGKFLELGFYDHIFQLVDSIALKQGQITLKPRSSFSSDLTTKEYVTPIVVPLESLAVIWQCQNWSEVVGSSYICNLCSRRRFKGTAHIRAILHPKVHERLTTSGQRQIVPDGIWKVLMTAARDSSLEPNEQTSKGFRQFVLLRA